MNKLNLFEQFYLVARSNFKSDAKLAEALGMSRGTFSYYTNKKYSRSPTLKTLEKWCDLLDITYTDNVFNINTNKPII